MAGSGRVEGCFRSDWRHPNWLPVNYDPDVYLREEGSDVDGAKEHDGEVLSPWIDVHAFVVGSCHVTARRCHEVWRVVR